MTAKNPMKLPRRQWVVMSGWRLLRYFGVAQFCAGYGRSKANLFSQRSNRQPTNNSRYCRDDAARYPDQSARALIFANSAARPRCVGGRTQAIDDIAAAVRLVLSPRELPQMEPTPPQTQDDQPQDHEPDDNEDDRQGHRS
jgi:hypothetical protein